VWNLICGIPLLAPSFLYYPHIDHHRRKHYGTQHDGEYLPITHQGRRGIIRFLLQVPVIPLLAVLRFAVLPPLCWIFPPLRRWVQRHASSMVVDPSYIRVEPSKNTRRIMFVQELLCFLWCWAAVGLPFLSRGLPWNLFLFERLIPFLVQAYLLALAILTLNHLRSLGSHRFANAGGEMSFVEQLLDSVSVSRAAWLGELWGPVGTRLHALHHLFPSLPYHALPEAHRRLMRQLPADSPYRQTVQASLNETLRDIWRRASAAESSSESDQQTLQSP
jgi:fatty acid desaturase